MITFHPQELHGYRGLQPGVQMVGTVGWTEYATEIIGPDDNFFHDSTINLESVRPVITANTADARVQVLMCVPTSPSEGVSGSLTDFCRSAQPFQPGAVDLDGSRHVLLLEITPTKTGQLDIAGVQVKYTDGIRHGDQHSGVECRWTVHS